MTHLEFGELVNKQLSRIEIFPHFLLEAQYNSRHKLIQYMCYYYPDESIEKLKDFQPNYFRSRSYNTTSELLAALTAAIDNFLAGTKEDITID